VFRLLACCWLLANMAQLDLLPLQLQHTRQPFPKFSAAEGATTASTCADCGDGIIQAGDKCDDGNTASKDGCSPSCKIEEGASCWRIGTPPMEKTECCAPCDAGSYRQGCTYMSADVANGICALCPVNTYKPAR